MSNLFHEELIEAAKNRKNIGNLLNPDAEASSFNASCGDRVSVQIEFNEDGEHIKDLKWQGDGCIISQAAMSLLSTVVIGESIAQVQQIDQKTVLELLNLESITPGRERCLMLGLSTIKQALASQSYK